MIPTDSQRAFTTSIDTGRTGNQEVQSRVDIAIRDITNTIESLETWCKNNGQCVTVTVTDDKHLCWRDDTGPF